MTTTWFLLRDDMALYPTINTLSLCSGAGGLDLGILIAAPSVRTVCYVEREAYAAANLVARMDNAALDRAPIWDDVATFDGHPWRGAVDLITAGYPCQPFSQAGKKRGTDDPRHLWPHIARIIIEVQPPFVFLENVANHLRLGFPEVASGLVSMGYRVAAGLYTAAEIGAPHKRERLFALAYASGERCQIKRLLQGQVLEAQRGNAQAFGLYPPGPDEKDAWAGYPATLKPGVCRGSDGLAYWVDRLRLTGNGVVPLVAAYAFRTLAAELSA